VVVPTPKQETFLGFRRPWCQRAPQGPSGSESLTLSGRPGPRRPGRPGIGPTSGARHWQAGESPAVGAAHHGGLSVVKGGPASLGWVGLDPACCSKLASVWRTASATGPPRQGRRAVAAVVPGLGSDLRGAGRRQIRREPPLRGVD